ncbi:MAG: hypothetical protein HRT97_14970 [Moritella sp.]|uniref:hypothetical protein n=1 Tax=Moritella sp. TaxID=78556 RepID=UPI0025DBC5AE|nr:hypothetical protein [Moritella sp.]NQZ93629.1 hypothetical protein [Moritella sp.]
MLKGDATLRIWGRSRGQETKALKDIANSLPEGKSTQVEWMAECQWLLLICNCGVIIGKNSSGDQDGYFSKFELSIAVEKRALAWLRMIESKQQSLQVAVLSFELLNISSCNKNIIVVRDYCCARS